MGNSSKPCEYPNCGKKGAYAFNKLCNTHWQSVIDENIKRFVEEDKLKKGK